MVKCKRSLVKSGMSYDYLRDNHSLNDLSNGFVLFTYYNSQDRSYTLTNIKFEKINKVLFFYYYIINS